MKRKAPPKTPSSLGLEVEAALAEHYARLGKSIKYRVAFRTPRGTPFAAERVTKGEINMWVPEQDQVRLQAEAAGLSIERSIPWPDGRSGNYGRLSSLKSVPGLFEETLLMIKVSSASQALKVAEALV
ncbi:hypothetical protein [Methylocella sp. CPCC 101449]|uniref:hypothetical protein n=1 Tax=Methylocella sp. CPCC 101449 TaxID=2987531 RepID=UPI0028910D9D|nr:hypothetical protein [Methylocella sp. CPCC 101449]MDT2020305.1 hypothetical protein [Methylocella sp. CPCC 101449]